jgi:hypothetical protein
MPMEQTIKELNAAMNFQDYGEESVKVNSSIFHLKKQETSA